MSTTKTVALSGTICDRPSTRTRAGRSVMALASRSERKAKLLRLSRNSIGLPPISSAEIRFSISSWLDPPVTACGSRPKATIDDAARQQPLAGAGARHRRGANEDARRQRQARPADRRQQRGKERRTRPSPALGPMSTTAMPSFSTIGGVGEAEGAEGIPENGQGSLGIAPASVGPADEARSGTRSHQMPDVGS